MSAKILVHQYYVQSFIQAEIKWRGLGVLEMCSLLSMKLYIVASH